MNLTSKYLTPLLQVALIVIGAWQVANQGGLTLIEGLQLIALAVGAFITYEVPLFEGKLAVAGKLAGAVVSAVLVALIDVVAHATDGTPIFTGTTLLLLLFAALQALATFLGVDWRLDTVKALLSSQYTSTEDALNHDEPATKAAIAGGAKVVERDESLYSTSEPIAAVVDPANPTATPAVIVPTETYVDDSSVDKGDANGADI